MRYLVSSKEERVAVENVCVIYWEEGGCGSSIHSPTWKEKGKGEEDISCLMVSSAMSAQDVKQSQTPLDFPDKLCAVVSCNDWVSKILSWKYLLPKCPVSCPDFSRFSL